MRDRALSRTSGPWRRTRSAVFVAAFIGALAPVVAATPAGADPAPEVTEDAVGIRLDENAILGDVLEAIEDELQPFVDQMIYDGGVDGAPLSEYESLDVSSNVELSFDVLTPGASPPSGGVAVHADIEDIELEYRADPWWPFDDCSIWIRPDDATIDVTGAVNAGAWPNTPVTVQPSSATWDDEPTVDYSGVCWWYLIDDLFEGWWDDFVGNDPESTASRIEAQVDTLAQDLLDDLWADHVTPVIDSLNEYGIDLGQLYTDDHGLIVTADLDATSGLTIPGIGGPFDVSGAEDSGADNDINDLLANRVSDDGPVEILVSIHPNIVNQFLYAQLTDLDGYMGAPFISDDIADVLVPPEYQNQYFDGFWYAELNVQVPPHTEPTGAGGAPQVQLPELRLEFYNLFFDTETPVATFEGDMGTIDLITEVRQGSDEWGPGFDTTGATLSVTRTQANAHASELPAQSSSEILPFAKAVIDNFNDDVLVQYLSLAPIEVGDFTVELCTTCGRYDDDERYTATFNIT